MNPVNFNTQYFRRLQDVRNSCLIGLLLTANFAFAQNAEPAISTSAAVAKTSEELAARYPSGSIQSIDMANRALAEVEQQRAKLERDYAAQQHGCYSKFLASACLDAAKESRQLALTRVRKVEVEANSFIRSARVVERDRNLAEKRASEANTRTKSPAGPAAAEPPAVEQPAAQHAETEKTDGAQRIAEHDAKLRQQQQAEKDSAPKRAQAVAAFEKKAKDAAARQRDIAAKKADKERRTAAKAAAVSAPAATAPAKP
ncbi:MAG: hypothetical protein ACHP7O_07950 [Burkholderiales bacterium]